MRIIKQIYMPLLNEGTYVRRPVVALGIGDNIYKILGTEQGLKPEDLNEEWLCPVESYVACRIEKNINDIILVVDREVI